MKMGKKEDVWERQARILANIVEAGKRVVKDGSL